MSKNKKSKARPRFACPRCKLAWVSCDPVCLICRELANPINEGAEKILKKYNSSMEV